MYLTRGSVIFTHPPIRLRIKENNYVRVRGVCVLHIKPFFLLVDTKHTPGVRADSSS